MGEYLKDRAETVRRLHELKLALDFAEYELAAGIALARTLGLSWDEVGGALDLTKQGASQWSKRRSVSTLGLSDDERTRIGRLIGVGEKVDRYAVRVIVSGKPGISKVVRETLSMHLRLDVAEDRARKRDGAEVWRIEPDGTETQLVIRPERPKRRAEAPAELSDW